MIDHKVIGVIAILIGFVGVLTIVIVRTTTGGRVPLNYGIVIDAGSRHTEIILYEWPADKDKCTGIVRQIYSEEADEAMSTYEKSTEFGDYLLPFINETKNHIASDRISSATLYLGATAGMRILNMTSPEKSQRIVNATRETFETKSGLITKEVGIISGLEEALFSWISTNYLTGQLRIQDNSLDVTVGMLDMGGASAQIAYEFPPNSSDALLNVKLYGSDHKVRVSSNLCFGADQARLRHVSLLAANSANEDPCLPKGSNRTYVGQELRQNVCLNGSEISKIGEKNYTFTGTGNPDACLNVVRRLVNISECLKIFDNCLSHENGSIGKEHAFIAMSGYYYSTKVLNLTNQRVIKDDFLKQTKEVCTLTINEIEKRKGADKSFTDVYCFQLTYIYHTLDLVYRFSGDWSNIEYKKKIDNTSLGWSLGYMINATNAIAVLNPSEPVITMFLFVVILIICVLLMLCGIVFLWRSMRGANAGNKGEIYEPIQRT